MFIQRDVVIFAVVYGIAIDTETGNVYFTNNNKVEVINGKGTERARVIEHSIDVGTYGVAVDVINR